MKKDILFVIPSLGAGGGEKSLINLLTQMDFNKYNVDLFILNNKGLFMEFIPKEVNVLEIPQDIKIFNKNLKASILEYITKGKFRLAYNRLMFCLKNRFNKNIGIAEQHSWKHLRKAIGTIDKRYDVAIGYLEKTSNYICVDCIRACKKIAWIHTDYNKLKLDKKYDKRYFKEVDNIITVSQECKNSLINNFKDQENKIRVIKNIVSPIVINKMARDKVDICSEKEENIIVSVGRLSYEKGFDMAVNSCKILVDKGFKIRWYLVGDGNERGKLQELIVEKGLQNKFILVGAQSNPYKYINVADIYVQPSRFEGKSIAMDEAKILHKPIVATNFTTVKDQIENNVTGVISEMNEESLAITIASVLMNSNLKEDLKNNLYKMNFGTEDEINKLYEII